MMAQSKDNEEESLRHVMAPPPKIYYKNYTNQAVENRTVPPPPPPLTGEYTAFGISHNPNDSNSILAPLRDHGVTQLYEDASNNIRELKKLNSSFLINFLDLLDILIQCPSSPLRVKKIEDLELLFYNFHHLINKFRPHQALETLIQMIKIQKEQKLDLVEQLNSKMETARVGLHSTINSLPSLLSHNHISHDADMTVTQVELDSKLTSINNEPQDEYFQAVAEIEELINSDLKKT